MWRLTWAIYDLSGNHDRSGLNEPQAWWSRKWLDFTGEHTEFSGVDRAKRPFPVEGTWERYSFRVGYLLFLVLGGLFEGHRAGLCAVVLTVALMVASCEAAWPKVAGPQSARQCRKTWVRSRVG